MPYEGEFAGYRPLYRITESDRVKGLLTRASVYTPSSSSPIVQPSQAPPNQSQLPKVILAIDGSDTEVPVRNGYPGAKVGYCTVASVLIDIARVHELDKMRPINPVEFRRIQNSSSIDCALPGTNVVTRRQVSARSSFREELYELFCQVMVDEDERIPLIDTFEVLLATKPTTHAQRCPYYEDDGCTHLFNSLPSRHTLCPQCKRPVYSTDALRIHERFNSLGSNGEAFGLVRHVWEHLLLVHLLRCFEKRNLLSEMDRIAFFLDGPLGVFGPPAWLSAAISIELKRLNQKTLSAGSNDLTILGIEKSGAFVGHFEAIDQTEKPGEAFFEPRDYMLLTDAYIKNRIQNSISIKRYGEDTYYGRKFFYKTSGGARIIGSLPFLSDEQDTISTDDSSLYPRFPLYCTLLDRLASSRYANALSPLVAAHAEAAIPLNLGSKVLEQLAKALIG